MKIAIVHSFYRAGPSGENIAVQMQANALAEAGQEVRVISRSTDAFINQPGYALASGITAATGVGPSPLKEINEFDPDIVHVHNLFPNWGDRWLEKLTYPLVATIHNFRPLCAAATLSLKGSPCELCPTKGSHHAVKNRCYQDSAIKSIPLAVASREPSSNRLLQNAAKLIYLSDEARRQFNKFIPEPLDHRGSVIPNFSAPIAERVGTTASKPHKQPWLFAGRLSAEKGIIQLLKAWPKGTPLIVAGSGPLAADAQQVAQHKDVTFLGQVPRDEVAVLMGESMGLVFPSVCMENSPLTLIEALGYGLPVVAKSGNAAAEVIQSYDAGRVFDDFDDLPAALRQAEDSNLTLKKNARILFDDKFTKSRWLEKTLEVYRCLLTR